MSDIHFISGLPRSGSTLLAAILRQNPRFTASIQSPVGYSLIALHQSLGGANEAKTFLTDTQRHVMLRGLFWSYYPVLSWTNSDAVVFDTNRRWCAHAALTKSLFPESKIICCVREPMKIVESIERLVRAHPLELNAIFEFKPNTTVYERVNMLTLPTGLFGYAWNAFKDAYYARSERLIIVEYDELAQCPRGVINRVHRELGYEPFDYNFDKIEQIPGAAEFDKSLGLPGLHDLYPQVTYRPQQAVLPPDIALHLPKPFWQLRK